MLHVSVGNTTLGNPDKRRLGYVFMTIADGLAPN